MKHIAVIAFALLMLASLLGVIDSVAYYRGMEAGRLVGWDEADKWHAYQETCPDLEGFDSHEVVMGRAEH